MYVEHFFLVPIPTLCGCVQNCHVEYESTEYKSDGSGSYLNGQHSHFILVDDGTKGKFGGIVPRSMGMLTVKKGFGFLHFDSSFSNELCVV